MDLLLVSATGHEVRRLADSLGLTDLKTGEIHRGIYKLLQVDLLITGVGIAATAYHLGNQLALKPYDLAIQAGIAGTYTDLLQPGAVVHVMEDSFADFGIGDGNSFTTPFEAGLTDPDSVPYEGGRLLQPPFRNVSPKDLLGEPFQGIFRSKTKSTPSSTLATLDRLPRVKGATTFTIRTSPVAIEQVRNYTGAAVESMEGASFFYAVHAARIPGIQLRAISNTVGERDYTKWHLGLAIDHLQKTLEELLKELSS